MKRTNAAVTAARRELRLQCPECTGLIRVPRDEQVEGATFECTHCAAVAALTREFDGTTGKTHWTLVDPLLDFDEDAPRAVRS